MELHQLKAFILAADLMSITQAADRLRIAQPAITRKIHNLEADLEVELFVRAHNRLYLTPAGQVFHHDVTVILRLLEEARSALLRFAPRRPAGAQRPNLPTISNRLSSGGVSSSR